MIKAVPMTENSWILYDKSERKGLMRIVDEKGYAILGGPYAGKYDDLKALKSAVDGKLTFEKMKANKTIEKSTVGEYPIKHDTYFEVEDESDLFLYTKIEGSKDVYAAGYFSVKGKEKWQTVFSPRHKSLIETSFHGPYKSKMDADHETKMENNK